MAPKSKSQSRARSKSRAKAKAKTVSKSTSQSKATAKATKSKSRAREPRAKSVSKRASQSSKASTGSKASKDTAGGGGFAASAAAAGASKREKSRSRSRSRSPRRENKGNDVEEEPKAPKAGAAGRFGAASGRKVSLQDLLLGNVAPEDDVQLFPEDQERKFEEAAANAEAEAEAKLQLDLGLKKKSKKALKRADASGGGEDDADMDADDDIDGFAVPSAEDEEEDEVLEFDEAAGRLTPYQRGDLDGQTIPEEHRARFLAGMARMDVKRKIAKYEQQLALAELLKRQLRPELEAEYRLNCRELRRMNDLAIFGGGAGVHGDEADDVFASAAAGSRGVSAGSQGAGSEAVAQAVQTLAYLHNAGTIAAKLTSAQNLVHGLRIFEKVHLAAIDHKENAPDSAGGSAGLGGGSSNSRDTAYPMTVFSGGNTVAPLRYAELALFLSLVLGKPLTNDLIAMVDKKASEGQRRDRPTTNRGLMIKNTLTMSSTQQALVSQDAAAAAALAAGSDTLASPPGRSPEKAPLGAGEVSAADQATRPPVIGLKELAAPVVNNLCTNLRAKRCEDVIRGLYVACKIQLLDVPYMNRSMYETTSVQKNCVMKLREMLIKRPDAAAGGASAAGYAAGAGGQRVVNYDAVRVLSAKGIAQLLFCCALIVSSTQKMNQRGAKTQAGSQSLGRDDEATVGNMLLPRDLLRVLYREVKRGVTGRTSQLEYCNLSELLYAVYKFNQLHTERDGQGGSAGAKDRSRNIKLSRREPAEEDLFTAVGQRVQREVVNVPLKNLVDVAYVFAQFGFRDDALFHAMCPIFMRHHRPGAGVSAKADHKAGKAGKKDGNAVGTASGGGFLSDSDFQVVLQAYIKFNLPLKDTTDGPADVTVAKGDFQRPSERPKPEKFEYERPEPIQDV